MNAVMYVPSASGGHARYASELLSAIRQVPGAHRVALVTSSDLASEFRTVDYAVHDFLPPMRTDAFASTLHWAGSRAAHYMRRERAFIRWMSENPDVDLVHFQEYNALFAAKHFERLARMGRRVFFTVHNIRDHRRRGRIVDGVLEGLWRAAWKRCHGLFVHSPGLKAELETFLGPVHPPVHVVPHGIWAIGSAHVLRSNSLEAMHRRRLLFFGVVRRNKGAHVLIEALRNLDGYTCCLAGAVVDPMYCAELRAGAARNKDGQVEMIKGYVEAADVPDLFERSSAVVLPYTEFASQSGVLHDALAFGVPVVATTVGALGETVEKLGIGEVVPPDDVIALRAAIERLHTPQRYAEAIAAVGRAREELSWTKCARNTLDAYNQSAGR